MAGAVAGIADVAAPLVSSVVGDVGSALGLGGGGSAGGGGGLGGIVNSLLGDVMGPLKGLLGGNQGPACNSPTNMFPFSPGLCNPGMMDQGFNPFGGQGGFGGSGFPSFPNISGGQNTFQQLQSQLMSAAQNAQSNPQGFLTAQENFGNYMASLQTQQGIFQAINSFEKSVAGALGQMG